MKQKMVLMIILMLNIINFNAITKIAIFIGSPVLFYHISTISQKNVYTSKYYSITLHNSSIFLSKYLIFHKSQHFVNPTTCNSFTTKKNYSPCTDG